MRYAKIKKEEKMMDVKIKFKELIITNAPSVEVVCKELERRNPDCIIDEAEEMK